MEPVDFLPEDLYLARQDAPHIRPARPFSQGDIFVDIPLVRAAKQSAKRANQLAAPVKTGPNALGMIVTHPCSSRSRSTHALKESISVAPIVRCPEGFKPPWAGYYEFFPLPGLKGGEAYVANLAEICPVRSEYLDGHRIACLSSAGLAALFHRLAMNSSRLERIPDHFAPEAERLSTEMDLWELWVSTYDEEDGFQAWLDEEFSGQPMEDEQGQLVIGSAERTGTSRREALRWNYEEVKAELEQLPDPHV
jgi:MoCo/4Fe-4S cofactor protein with predicted Tat translocation signal